jgi:hypothetical protein
MTEGKDSIVVVWTSGERDVALEVAFPYTLNSKVRNWWEDVTLVVWGPSTQLVCHDLEIQAYLEKIKEAGITIECCKACADRYGLSEKVQSLGIHVKYMGEPTTKYLKEGRHILTY